MRTMLKRGFQQGSDSTNDVFNIYNTESEVAFDMQTPPG